MYVYGSGVVLWDLIIIKETKKKKK
jgi:hypothetical protein